MIEFFEVCLWPVNLPFTVLLGLVFLYWVSVLVGAIAFDTFDVDPGGHADVDGHIDVDVGGGGHSGIHSALAVLRFFNVGEVPLMILVSVFALVMWTIAVLGNYYLNDPEDPRALITVGLLVGNIIVSLFVAKLVTMPLCYVFKHMDAGLTEKIKVVGKTCVIKTAEATPTSGQAEMETDGAPLLLNVRTREGETLAKGDEALIVDHHEAESGTYDVVKFDLEV